MWSPKVSNRKQTDRHIEANSESKDGVLTWIGFVKSYSHPAPSMKQRKIDKLLDVAALPCSKLGTEGVIDWLETWETACASLEALTGDQRYTNELKLQKLNQHLQGIPEIGPLVLHIANKDMNLEEAMDYIRDNIHRTCSKNRKNIRGSRVHTSATDETLGHLMLDDTDDFISGSD